MQNLNSSIPSLDNGFSRETPSPRYPELLGFYKDMHENGDPSKGSKPEETFDGRSLKNQISNIQYVIKIFKAKTILDYGSGKVSYYNTQGLVYPNGEKHANLAAFCEIAFAEEISA